MFLDSKDTKEHLKEMCWEVLLYPPYSPDLEPTDYILFELLINHIRNKAYRNLDGLENDLNSFFNKKTPEFYKN